MPTSWFSVKSLAQPGLFSQRLRGLSHQLHRWSSGLTLSEKEGVMSWIEKQDVPIEQPNLTDYINPSHLRALACTLATLDGTIPLPPHRHVNFQPGSLLSPGHLLIFCNPVSPERDLDLDATIRLLPPPPPFARRMWAAGKFEFRRPLRIGDNIRAERIVSSIDAKRFDSENPMIIMDQIIKTKMHDESDNDVHVVETRSHVYLPLENERRVRTIKGLPKPDFSISYTPTETTLFRFSALTFNAHRIHLDKEYSQNVENLPERLVHGPMTAMMLLEAIENHRSEHLRIITFDYRATNQLFVNRSITIHGAWTNANEVKVWAESEDGVVGMVGEARLAVDSTS